MPGANPLKRKHEAEEETKHHNSDSKVCTGNPRELICELGRQFYGLGWVSGTGGGISIKKGSDIFVAPSGVQKERLSPADMFIIDINGDTLCEPAKELSLSLSQCTPLFLVAYQERNAGAVIHSHSRSAVLASLVFEKEFKVSHLEMMKGIYSPVEKRQMRYDEELIVPIIDNTPFEADLRHSLAKAVADYPNTCAVLVKRHGVYVWGDSWQQAKTIAESYDYLFDIVVEMKKLSLPSTNASQ